MLKEYLYVLFCAIWLACFSMMMCGCYRLKYFWYIQGTNIYFNIKAYKLLGFGLLRASFGALYAIIKFIHCLKECFYLAQTFPL